MILPRLRWHLARAWRRARARLRRPLLRPGGYVIDCSYHPCVVVERNGDDVTVASMVEPDVREKSCSVLRCNVRPLSPGRAGDMMKCYRAGYANDGKRGGNRALAVRYGGWTEAAFNAFWDEWRA